VFSHGDPDAGRLRSGPFEINPQLAGCLCNLGIIKRDRGEFSEAEAYYRRAIELEPRYIEPVNNLVVLLLDQERYSEALPYARKAVAHETAGAEAHNNLGVILFHLLDRDGEAEACYRKALQIQPDYADAHTNLGNLLRHQGHYSDAEASLRRALIFDPDHASAHQTLSFVLLARGALAEGWEEYEWRPRPDRTREVASGELQEWRGRVQAGQRILILAEQGVGDEVMFASCIPDIVTSGPDCVLESDARLVPLFARSFPQVKVIAHKSADESVEKFLKRAGSVDVWTGAGSLPRCYRCDFEDFPRRPGYLAADSHQVEEWKQRYLQLGSGLKVGISWRGGGNKETQEMRSTDLLRWSELFNIPQLVFIDLQYGDTDSERSALHSQTGLIVHHFDEMDPLHNLDGFAAQLAALDLVISVDNATVHLAGALGVPTWVLLPYVAEWRWFLDRDDSPWYESVRLIRQQRRAEWKEVFENVNRMLNDFVGQHRSSTQRSI